MCDCLEPVPASSVNPWLHLAWQDSRNSATYLELLSTLPKCTERRADRLVRTMPLFADAPSMVVSSPGLWAPARELRFANERELQHALVRFGALGDFQSASAGESMKKDDKACKDCEEVRCGPNVTSQVIAVVNKTNATFATWDDTRKFGACGALTSLEAGVEGRVAREAWDVGKLHVQGWILGYRPSCASPTCQDTVQVGDQCHYAGSVNYVIFGAMCRLCNDYFIKKVGETPFGGDSYLPLAMSYSPLAISAMIYAHKGPIPFVREASGNYEPSQQWAKAGYDGWPKVAAPPGDRPKCAPTCPQAYTGDPFDVKWKWLDPEGKGNRRVRMHSF